jgi:phage shock protein PspC (stress-responsive transcriptional regulator)
MLNAQWDSIMNLIQIAFISFFVSVAAGLWGYYQWNGTAARLAKGLFALAATVSLALIFAAVFIHDRTS